MRIIIGVTGASGTIYGWRLLEKLHLLVSVETHLIVSRSAERTAFLELGKTLADFKKLADHWYPLEDIGSRLASGSFLTDAMIVAPCSIHTMSAIAGGITSNLMIRAADVILKEHRKLILMVRETPFIWGQLREYDSIGGDGRRYLLRRSLASTTSLKPLPIWWSTALTAY